MDNDLAIFKILTNSQWEDFKAQKVFKGSDHDLADGFIHLVCYEQIGIIRQKYFKSHPEVYLLEFSSSELGTDLKWEEASDHDKYPHYYQTLSYPQIKHVKKI